MSPRVRTLLVLACLVVAGVTALALLANRYRSMVPEKSVLELPVENPQVPRPIPAEEAPQPPAEPPAPEATPSPAPAPSEADRAALQGFLDVRGALQALIAERDYAARVVAAELVDEQTKFDKVPANHQFFGAFRFTRQEALEKAGMTPQEYQRVRDAFREWEAGKPAGTLGAAFAQREDEARKANLGGLEPLDYKLAF